VILRIAADFLRSSDFSTKNVGVGAAGIGSDFLVLSAGKKTSRRE